MLYTHIVSDRSLGTWEEGSELRQLLELDAVKNLHREIHFDITTYCTAVSDPFFLGLFELSLSRHLSSSSFFRQYSFTAPEAFDHDLYIKIAGYYLGKEFRRTP